MTRAVLLLLPLWLAGPAVVDTVLSVGDGDTLTVTGALGRRTIRLACIDAPETAQRPDGPSARAAPQQLAPVGSRVEVRASKVDRYGRTVAELWRAATNVNISLVRQGHAYVYRQYLQAPCLATAYLSAEQQAERARLGVWSVIGRITRPWDFRRRGRRAGDGEAGSSSSVSARCTCRSIGDHARAQELLREGHSYLDGDGDGDGEACESLC